MKSVTPGPWFRHCLRVRYQETDQMGVVYHANYLNWFEIGRTELIRQMGFPYTDIEAKGFLLPVIHAEIDFHKPAKYDDVVMIYTRIESYTNVRIEMGCQVHRADPEQISDVESAVESGFEPSGELLVRGLTRHVWVNRDFRPVRIDQELPELFAVFQSCKK